MGIGSILGSTRPLIGPSGAGWAKDRRGPQATTPGTSPRSAGRDAERTLRNVTGGPAVLDACSVRCGR